MIANKPKVILPDLKLPTVEGLKMARAFKADPRAQLVHVVMPISSQQQPDFLEG